MIADIIIVLIVIVFGFFGLKKGFMKSLLSFAGVFLALVIAFIFADNISAALVDTQLGKIINDFSLKMLNGIGGLMTTVVPSYDELLGTLSQTLPMVIAKILAESINKYTGDIANKTIAELLTPTLSNILLTILSFVIIFVVLLIVFAIVKAIVGAITDLPIIKQLDKALGFVLGVIKGIVFVYVILLVLSFVSGAPFMQSVMTIMNESKLALYLYNNNLILIVGQGLLNKVIATPQIS